MSEQCGPWSTWEAYEDHILDHCKRDQQYDGRSSIGHCSTVPAAGTITRFVQAVTCSLEQMRRISKEVNEA